MSAGLPTEPAESNPEPRDVPVADRSDAGGATSEVEALLERASERCRRVTQRCIHVLVPEDIEQRRDSKPPPAG